MSHSFYDLQDIAGNAGEFDADASFARAAPKIPSLSPGRLLVGLRPSQCGQGVRAAMARQRDPVGQLRAASRRRAGRARRALPGRTLQIACAYGDITNLLLDRVSAASGRLDIVDAAPVQLENLRGKLPADAPVRRLLMDSATLDIPSASYDRAILFFLLHEQPEAWRRRTLAEALRVVRPGGRIVIVDYARPHWWNPMRYLFSPVLRRLEPFALDLWNQEIAAWLPEPWASRRLERRSFFGGLYQQVTLEL